MENKKKYTHKTTDVARTHARYRLLYAFNITHPPFFHQFAHSRMNNNNSNNKIQTVHNKARAIRAESRSTIYRIFNKNLCARKSRSNKVSKKHTSEQKQQQHQQKRISEEHTYIHL